MFLDQERTFKGLCFPMTSLLISEKGLVCGGLTYGGVYSHCLMWIEATGWKHLLKHLAHGHPYTVLVPF